MDRVLRFKHHLRPEPAGVDRGLLFGERDAFLLRGRLFALLLPLLDGRRTVAEVIAALDGQASAADVDLAIGKLMEAGYLAEGAPALEPARAGFWEALGLDARQAAERLSATPVSVCVLGGGTDAATLVSALVTALDGAGVTVREGAALVVVSVADYLAPELEGWHREARDAGRTWMLVKPGGLVPWVGPIFRPGEGACWACLAHRLRENRAAAGFLGRLREVAAPPPVALPASARVGEGLAALAMARWIASGGADPVGDHLRTLDLASGEGAPHRVAKRPECPDCGDAAMVGRRTGEPVAITARPKRFTDDGAHRVATPEETWARWAHLVDPITGAVAHVGPVAGRDHPLGHVYRATFPVVPRHPAPLAGDFHQASWGKGRTAAEARAGALCEAIERRSAIFRGDEARVRARFDALGAEAIHPGALLHFSEAQHRARGGTASRVRRDEVPLPFDDRAEIEWTPAWSLTHGRRRFVPTAHAYTRYPARPEARFFVDESNGCAAGNCLEEAIVHGFLELVERDSLALWWYGRAPRPEVALDRFGEPWLTALTERYRALGQTLWVLDLTADLGLPVFVALARPTSEVPGAPRLNVGFGCHFEARLALSRALTELGQTFVPDRPLPEAFRRVPLSEHAFLFPDPLAAPRGPTDFPSSPRADLADDVRTCVALAAGAELETVVLDQTRPDLGLPVVKVMVPGLRHFWPRLGPGRLYDVPVRLGWRAEPLGEDELNPLPLFF